MEYDIPYPTYIPYIGPNNAPLGVKCQGRVVTCFILHIYLHTYTPHIYFIVVYLFRSTDDVSLSLIPLVHVVDQEETGYGVGHRLSVSSPLPWGVGDAYDVCGASMCAWDMGGGGWSPLGSSRPLFNDFRAVTTL